MVTARATSRLLPGDRFALSTPGKVILMGEHAAVYGRPALVAAVDRRTAVLVTGSDGDGLVLDLPDLGVHEATTWSAMERAADEARGRWQSFQRGECGVADVSTRDPSTLVRVAIGEAITFLGKAPSLGAQIRVTSELPVGGGLGSSASVAVALAAAVCQLSGHTIKFEELDAVALEIERRQHGTPSGVDSATVLRGGVLWVEQAEAASSRQAPSASSSELLIEPLAVDPGALALFRRVDTGAP